MLILICIISLHFSNRTKLAQLFTVEEIAHVLLPRAGVINSYVVEVSTQC